MICGYDFVPLSVYLSVFLLNIYEKKTEKSFECKNLLAEWQRVM